MSPATITAWEMGWGAGPTTQQALRSPSELYERHPDIVRGRATQAAVPAPEAPLQDGQAQR